MDAKTDTLIPAADLARDNPVRIPNESAAFRAARTALRATPGSPFPAARLEGSSDVVWVRATGWRVMRKRR